MNAQSNPYRRILRCCSGIASGQSSSGGGAAGEAFCVSLMLRSPGSPGCLFVATSGQLVVRRRKSPHVVTSKRLVTTIRRPPARSLDFGDHSLLSGSPPRQLRTNRIGEPLEGRVRGAAVRREQPQWKTLVSQLPQHFVVRR